MLTVVRKKSATSTFKLSQILPINLLEKSIRRCNLYFTMGEQQNFSTSADPQNKSVTSFRF